MTAPKPRYGTHKAIIKLANDLELPYNTGMQDWSYEVANGDDIEKYHLHYEQLTNDDEKFVLMEIIIQANEENNKYFQKYWDKTKILLKNDALLHKYTIFYWCVFDNENLDDCFFITKNMRELYSEMFL